MRKYDMRAIMTRAWELVKKTGKTISEGLKQAWKEAKAAMDKIYIKDWFLTKMLVDNFMIGAFLVDILGVVKETAKAYLLKVEVGYTSDLDEVKNVWVPKSCTMNYMEKLAEEKAQAERFEAGCRAYEKMLAFAKKHDIKTVRKGMRKETIIRKIAEAGYEYQA